MPGVKRVAEKYRCDGFVQDYIMMQGNVEWDVVRRRLMCVDLVIETSTWSTDAHVAIVLV